MGGLASDDWKAVQSLFDALVDLDPAGRAKGLKRAKIAPHLREQVEALLAADAQAGILDGDPVGLPAADTETSYSSLASGTVVGGFTIERLIGRGGMGEVYLARRTATDFNQTVALKLLRAEAAERGALFDRERRLLARLEHPGIARLIDGGIAPDGRPFMAMEYVDGVPIDAWCRDHAASLDTRLALFREICGAVAYAHASLVVHRDLKPSNILIDTAGKVRLLDFGIAKLLDDAEAVPAATQAILTPDYAAPEQLGGEPSTVAADIYALGVVLFELVVGAGPWRKEGASVPSIIRRVLHEDPPLPSRAAAERADAPVPPARISGDLDAIILKAMRRDPQERYRSVGDLDADIQRHRDLKPVSARAGSTRYMIGRFVRRYRWAVAAGAIALSAILIGSAGIAWQARQTAIERDLALAEARRSESIVQMLTVMFRDTAESDAGQDATVKQMLDQTAERLVASLDTSARSAMLITTLYDLYNNLEDAAGADALLRRAIAKGIGKGDDVATARIEMRLASTAAALSKPDDIKSLLDRSEAVFRRDPARFRYELADVTSARAQLARREGDYDTAIGLLMQALPGAEQAYAEKHRDLVTFYNNLLVYMVEADRLAEMPAIFAQADAMLQRTRMTGSAPGLAIEQLKGVRLMKLGENARAEAIFAKIVARRRAVFGASAGLAVDLFQLGRAQMALGNFGLARKTLAESRPMAAENLGPTAMPTLIVGLSLAEAEAETGDSGAAQALHAELAPTFAATPPTGVLQGMFIKSRAVVLASQGRMAEASAELDKAEAIFKAAGRGGVTHLQTLPALRKRIAEGR